MCRYKYTNVQIYLDYQRCFSVKKILFSHLRSFLWLRSCLLSFEDVRKDHWQPGWTQTYGLTPVWTRSWAISLDWILNSLSQVEHCNRAFSIALKLKIEIGDCCVSERQLERTLMQFLLCFKVVKTQRISINWKFFRICSLIHWKKIFLLQKSVTYKQTAYFLHFFATFWKQMKSPLTFDRAVATTMVKRIGRGQNLKWIKRHARIRSWKIPSQARQCRSTSTKDQHDSLHQFLYMFFFYFSASTS